MTLETDIRDCCGFGRRSKGKRFQILGICFDLFVMGWAGPRQSAIYTTHMQHVRIYFVARYVFLNGGLLAVQ